MITITPDISLEEKEINLEYVRSSGPGGQNINKVSTSVKLRFDIQGSGSLQPEVKQRLSVLAGSRLTEDGVMVIEAKRYRTQEQNRTDAIQRLVTLIQKALAAPKKRHPTRPTPASTAERLESKRKRSAVKRLRRDLPEE